MPKKINAFEVARAKPKRKLINAQKIAPAKNDIADAIDKFVLYREQEYSAKINKMEAAASFQEFAIDTYVDGALSGKQNNPVLKGHEKQCKFIIKDQTSNIKDDNKKAIAELGINFNDVVEEINEFVFDADVMKNISSKEIEEIGEYLGAYLGKYPGLLKVNRKTHAKRGILYSLPEISKYDPSRMKKLINYLQYVKLPQ